MKAYTDLEQSKKLAEILSFESIEKGLAIEVTEENNLYEN